MGRWKMPRRVDSHQTFLNYNNEAARRTPTSRTSGGSTTGVMQCGLGHSASNPSGGVVDRASTASSAPATSGAASEGTGLRSGEGWVGGCGVGCGLGRAKGRCVLKSGWRTNIPPEGWRFSRGEVDTWQRRNWELGRPWATMDRHPCGCGLKGLEGLDTCRTLAGCARALVCPQTASPFAELNISGLTWLKVPFLVWSEGRARRTGHDRMRHHTGLGLAEARSPRTQWR